ncbi:hypothetical protein C8K18_10528 [Paraburkholderia sp. GV068]|nr:hypothetical protein C8K19_10528 [Paraburkholderia sp. GV072]PUB05113.1 hypothetical protein C8K18_10528 [Paraburkholderia sp. GV068]
MFPIRTWLRRRLLVNPCDVDSVVGDWMEKIFPTGCWCCAALRGMLYGMLVSIAMLAIAEAIYVRACG